MHLIGLGEAALPQGRVHLWRMDPAAWQAAVPHPAPPSANQRARLTRALADRSRGIASIRWGAVCFELNGPPDPDALTCALQRFTRRHDTLHSGFAEGVRRVVAPHQMSLQRLTFEWVADPGQTLAHHFDLETDPLGWPAYAFAAIEEAHRLTVLLAFDHLHSDLYTFAIAASEVARFYRDPDATLPEPGSHVRFSKTEGESVLADPVVGAWRDFVGACGGQLPSSGLPLGVAKGTVEPLVHRELRLLDAAAGEALETWCRREGVSFFAALLAAVAVATAELTGVTTYRTVLALQTRPARADLAVGWFVTAAPVSVAVDGGIESVLALAQRAALRAHRFVSTPIDMVMELMPEAGGEKVSWLSYVDFRAVAGDGGGSGDWNARILANDRLGNDADLWLNRAHDGTYLYCRYPQTSTAHATIASLAHLMVSALSQLATPACRQP